MSFEKQFNEAMLHHSISTDLSEFRSGHLPSPALKKLTTMKDFFDMASSVVGRRRFLRYLRYSVAFIHMIKLVLRLKMVEKWRKAMHLEYLSNSLFIIHALKNDSLLALFIIKGFLFHRNIVEYNLEMTRDYSKVPFRSCWS